MCCDCIREGIHGFGLFTLTTQPCVPAHCSVRRGTGQSIARQLFKLFISWRRQKNIRNAINSSDADDNDDDEEDLLETLSDLGARLMVRPNHLNAGSRTGAFSAGSTTSVHIGHLEGGSKRAWSRARFKKLPSGVVSSLAP